MGCSQNTGVPHALLPATPPLSPWLVSVPTLTYQNIHAVQFYVHTWSHACGTSLLTLHLHYFHLSILYCYNIICMLNDTIVEWFDVILSKRKCKFTKPIPLNTFFCIHFIVIFWEFHTWRVLYLYHFQLHPPSSESSRAPSTPSLPYDLWKSYTNVTCCPFGIVPIHMYLGLTIY